MNDTFIGISTGGGYNANLAKKNLEQYAGPAMQAEFRAANADSFSNPQTTDAAAFGTGSSATAPSDEKAYWQKYQQDKTSIDWSKYR